jgi:hypothetical protein
MRIQQLREGQKEQIENLRASAPVALFHPTDIEDAADLLTRNDSHDIELMVMPSLKYAVRVGEVVIKFHAQGKDIYAPREVQRNRQDREIAVRKYPESFRPEVSFALTSQRPVAIFKGYFSPGRVENLFVMQNGRPEPMSIQQYIEYVVDFRATHQRRKQSQVDVVHD